MNGLTRPFNGRFRHYSPLLGDPSKSKHDASSIFISGCSFNWMPTSSSIMAVFKNEVPFSLRSACSRSWSRMFHGSAAEAAVRIQNDSKYTCVHCCHRIFPQAHFLLVGCFR